MSIASLFKRLRKPPINGWHELGEMAVIANELVQTDPDALVTALRVWRKTARGREKEAAFRTALAAGRTAAAAHCDLMTLAEQFFELAGKLADEKSGAIQVPMLRVVK